jgi:16S rRNA (guanine966-N2)-methyltransferase
MRVVSGTLGGRVLKGPAGRDARPTMDKVRAAIFNSLASMDVIRDARVVDLFAGTGAFGIEAMSRGAASADFVEKFAKNASLIRENLASLGVVGGVHAQDVMTFVQQVHEFDIAFVDPPYVFEEWTTLLGCLRAGLVVCESNRSIEPVGEWDVIRQKNYGGTHVTILQRGVTA